MQNDYSLKWVFSNENTNQMIKTWYYEGFCTCFTLYYGPLMDVSFVMIFMLFVTLFNISFQFFNLIQICVLLNIFFVLCTF